MAPASDVGRIREVFINSIRALAEALEAKDPYTAGHSRRVTELSCEIAKKMDLSQSETGHVRLASMLHDIGKIGVRESVLNKEGELSEEEYDHIMQHTVIGRRILEPIFRGSEILEIVTYHHEHFDGNGRPEGLMEDEIPLGARIVALADAVDAMGSARPYRPGMPAGEIGGEVEANCGTQFDPEVVEAFFVTRYGQQLMEARGGGAGEWGKDDAAADVLKNLG